MREHEQKVGLSKVNWVLSILGILFFSMFIILPPIFRAVFKEEEPDFEPPVVETVEKSISCFKEMEDVEGYQSYQYTIRGINDNLDMVAYTENFKYQTLPEGTSLECEALNSMYSGLDGLYYNCQILESEKITDTRINVSVYQGSIPMVLEDYQGETFESYHTKLVDSGFTCHEIE